MRVNISIGPRPSSVLFGKKYVQPKGAVEKRDLVIIESPFANPDPHVMQDNVAFAQKSMIDSLMFHHEAPMLSHLLYTQVLNEDDKQQRDSGIKAGLAWREATKKTVVYGDRGISQGMQYGIHAATEMGNQVEYRNLKDCPHKAEVEQLYQQISTRTHGLSASAIA